MFWNEEKGGYEATLIIKQGYYDLAYATVDRTAKKKVFSFDETEGNYWETGK